MAPIFIVGCDRSGTTMLRLMLNMSRSLHIPAESGFIPELLGRSTEYGNFSTPRERWFFIRDLQCFKATWKTKSFDIFSLGADEAYEVLGCAAPTDYPGAVAALYEASARKQNKSRWGDKTPVYILHIETLAELFPGSRFVHIIRDPRDVAASICRTGWITGLRNAARFWVQRVEAGRSSGRRLGPDRYREIRYESLITDPLPQLKDLCEWLQIEFSPDMTDFYKTSDRYIPKEHKDLFPLASKPLDASRALAWKHAMTRNNIADVESVAGSLMAEIGYEITGYKLNVWQSSMRRVFAVYDRSRKHVRGVRSLLEDVSSNHA